MKSVFFSLLFSLLATQVWAVTPPQFANLSSCQISTDMNSLATTCTNKQAPNIAMPAIYDGTEATKFNGLFGAKYFRITIPSAALSADPAITSMVPNYSKQSAWNSDGTKLLIYANTGYFYLFDGNTYQFIRRISHPGFPNGYVFDGLDMEPRWSNTDPDKLYYRASMTLYSYSVASDTSSVVHTFTNAELGTTDCTNIASGDEGNHDDSDRYWAYYCQNSGYTQKAVFVYDKQTDTVLGHKLLSAGGLCGAGACYTKTNNVTMSHSGNYVVVEWESNPANYLRTPTTQMSRGTEVYDRSLNFVSQVSEMYVHFDVSVLADGTEVYVGAADTVYNPDGSFAGPSNYGEHAVRAVRLSDGQVMKSCVKPLEQYQHISGRTDSSKFRGWILYSTYDQTYAGKGITSDGGIFSTENFALNMDTCEVRRIAHNQSNTSANYSSEPHASMNFDFTKIIWGSNWRDQGATTNAYVVELPAGDPPPPPVTSAAITGGTCRGCVIK